MTENVRLRLFVAASVREPARAALEAAVTPLRDAHPGLRWVDTEMWHVTLAFLGSVPVDRAELVDEAAARVAGRHPRSELRLTGHLSTFGRSVLYAELEADDALLAAQSDLAEQLDEAGFTLEQRAFTPHLTLGRAPRGTRIPPQLVRGYAGPSVRWAVPQLLVVRSRLRVGGAVHEIRSAHALGGVRVDGAGVR